MRQDSVPLREHDISSLSHLHKLPHAHRFAHHSRVDRLVCHVVAQWLVDDPQVTGVLVDEGLCVPIGSDQFAPDDHGEDLRKARQDE